MTDQEWLSAWEIFESLSDIPRGEHIGFVERATSDPRIRARVLELLAESQHVPDSGTPEAHIAQRIGKYEILTLLGEGGSGTVYAAHDTELDRRVALKFLTPDLYGGGSSELDRLTREARAASKLNHPNIVTVYEVIRPESGPAAVVTEFVEGKALRELCGSPVRIEQILDWGRQAASALEAAHKARIIHRDVKPENIMVRQDGLIKLLDFGLAQRLDLHDMTGVPGVPEGTLRYMSPEQSRGLVLTAASDVFSLGMVLYELATGVHPFATADPLEAMRRIASSAPRLPADLNPRVPLPLQSLLLRMMEKQPAVRPSAGEVASDLTAIVRLEAEREALRAFARRRRYWTMGIAAAALAGVVSLFVATGRFQRAPGPPSVTRLTSLEGHELNPAISPDGLRVAFSWNGGTLDNYDIYVQPVSGASDAAPPVRLTTDPAHDLRPAWSPDGQQIAFIRLTPDSKVLYTRTVSGGPERRVLALDRSSSSPVWANDASQIQTYPGPTWAADGKGIVVANRDENGEALYLISVDGTRKTRLASLGQAYVVDSPTVFNDGSSDGRLAYVRLTGTGVSDIFVSEHGRPPRRITRLQSLINGLAWGDEGKEILFTGQIQNTRGLWSVPLTGGEPVLQPGAGRTANSPSCSRDGKRIVFAERIDDRNIWRTDVDARTGRFGPPRRFIASSQQEHSPSFSPDGRSITFVSDRSGSEEIWICGLDGGGLRPLTKFGSGVAGTPRWSPDGKRIAFDARPGRNSAIYVIEASGGSPKALTDGGAEDMMPSWSHDGRWIYFVSRRTGPDQIWKIPADGGTAEEITRHFGGEARESPDGQTLYFHCGPERGICQVSVNGGEETQVPELAQRPPSRYWTVSDHGIYFAPLATGSRQFEFFDLSTRRIRPVTRIDKDPAFGTPSLAVSPDERTIVYAQVDRSESDIVMIARQ